VRDLPPVLGWKEHAALPEWGITRLRVKLDTGARTSALHVEELRVVEHRDVGGEQLPVIRFKVLVGSRDEPRRRTVTAATISRRRVRDTGAKAELRHVVRTRVVCGPLDREIDITITDRSGMNFRMLLGRLALEGAAVVDPAHGYLHSSRPPRRGRGA
jgi:hypothetical protein